MDPLPTEGEIINVIKTLVKIRERWVHNTHYVRRLDIEILALNHLLASMSMPK